MSHVQKSKVPARYNCQDHIVDVIHINPLQARKRRLAEVLQYYHALGEGRHRSHARALRCHQDFIHVGQIPAGAHLHPPHPQSVRRNFRPNLPITPIETITATPNITPTTEIAVKTGSVSPGREKLLAKEVETQARKRKLKAAVHRNAECRNPFSRRCFSRADLGFRPFQVPLGADTERHRFRAGQQDTEAIDVAHPARRRHAAQGGEEILVDLAARCQCSNISRCTSGSFCSL